MMGKRTRKPRRARRNSVSQDGPKQGLKAEDFRQRLQQTIDSLCGLLRNVDPISAIQAATFVNCFVNPETYKEATHPGREVNVEYLHSLALALANPGANTPTVEQAQECADTAARVLETACLYFIRSNQEDGFADDELRSTVTEYLLVRGASFPQHERELLLDLFGEHDAELTKSIGMSSEALLDGINALAELVSERLAAALCDPQVERQDLFNRQLCQLSPGVDAPSILLELLSAPFGANEAFLTLERAPGWPTNPTCILATPIIRDGGKYWAPNPVLIRRSGRHVLENAVKGNTKYFQRSFQPARAAYLESRAVEHLCKLLGNPQVYRNLYYTHEGKRCEVDAIIVAGRLLFVVEMKAGDVSLAARRGAPERLKSTFKALVADAYDQGLRTKRYIHESKSARFEDQQGRPVVTIDVGTISKTFLVNVTLSDLGHLATHLNSARAAGLLTGNEWVWSVFVNDLRIIAELIESPAEFLLFLERRLATHDRGAFRSSDEIDYLGFFFEQGLYLEDAGYKKASTIVPGGLTTNIESYYNGLAGWRSPAPKPRLSISDPYRAFVTSVLELQRSESIEVGAHLLGFSGRQQRELLDLMRSATTACLNDGQPHSFTCGGLEWGMTVLVLLATHDWTAQKSRTTQHCRVKKYQTRCSGWLLLILRASENDLTVADLVLLEGQWQQDAELEIAATGFASQLVARHIEQHGLPKRNDRCPCNSGRKFKVCCGRDA